MTCDTRGLIPKVHVIWCHVDGVGINGYLYHSLVISRAVPCLLGVISAPAFIREGEYRQGETKHSEAVVHDPTREAHANFVSQEKHEYQNTSYKSYLTKKLVNRLHQKPLDPNALSCNNIIETSIEPANVGIIQIYHLWCQTYKSLLNQPEVLVRLYISIVKRMVPGAGGVGG